MSNERRTISVILSADIDGFKKGLSEANDAFEKVKDKFSKSFESIKEIGSNLTTYVTLPITLLGGQILKTAGDFESSMNELKAITQATGDEFDAMREKAKQIGATTQFSASEASKAMTMLAKNGLKFNQILGGGIDATMALSAATKADLSEAADIATDAMLQFNLQAKELPKVADLITGATINSKFGIQDFGYALANAGGVAGSMKVKLEEFAAAMSVTSSAFSSGGDAGTSFKTFLLRLSPTTKSAKDAMKQLGIESFYTNGKLDDLATVAEKLKKATRGLSDEAKTNAFKDIFGDDAIRTALMLSEAGADGINKMVESLKNVKASEIAKTQMEGFNGAMKALSSAFEAVQLAIADSGLLSFFTSLINHVTVIVQKIAQLNPNILKFGTIIAGLVASIGPLLFVIGKLGTGLPILFATISKGATVFMTLGKAILFASSKLLIIAGIVAAVIAVIVAIGLAVKSAYDKFESFRNIVNKVGEVLGKFWEKLVSDVKKALGFMGKAIDAVSDFFKKAFGTDEATKSLDKVNQEVKQVGDSVKKELSFGETFKENLKGLGEFVSGGLGKLTNGLSDLIFVKEKSLNFTDETTQVKDLNKDLLTLDNTIGGVGAKAKQTKIELQGLSLPTLTQSANIDVTTEGRNKMQEEAARKLQELLPKQVAMLDTVKQAAMATDYQLALMLKRMSDNIPTFNDFKLAVGNLFEKMGQDVASGDKDLKDFAKSAVSSIKRIISALIAQGIAGVVSQTLTSAGITGPFAVALAGAAGAAAAALFNTIIPKFAEGGLVYGKTLGMVGEYPGAATNPEVIAPLSKLQNILASSMQTINSDAIVQAIRSNPPTMVNIDADGFAVYENRRLQTIQYVTNRFNWQNK